MRLSASFRSGRVTALTACYYLYIPAAIFLCGWVQPAYGVPLALLLGGAPPLMFRNGEGSYPSGTGKKWIIIAALLLIWVILSGIGGYVWQNRWDHFFRNAVFSDLVGREWPVEDGGNALVYYIGFWLPAAACAKLTSNIEIGWTAQLLYGFIGIWLAFRLMIMKIGSVKLRYLLPFIFFSGADILYVWFLGDGVPRNFHIETWSGLAMWESNTTLLFWVYNQAVPAWVATMLLLNFGRMPGVASMTLCYLLISAPFPTVGLFPLACYYVVEHIWNAGGMANKLRTLFDPLTLLAIAGAIPAGIFLTMNSSVGITLGMRGYSPETWFVEATVLFVLEIGLFIPFIFEQVKRSPEFYILLLTSLLLLPVCMGRSLDFNSRVELPLNYFLTMQVAVYLRDWQRHKYWTRLLFILLSAVALVTPALEMARIAFMSLKEPVADYRSWRRPTVFEFDELRGNFVADSLLISPPRRQDISLFRYRSVPCREFSDSVAVNPGEEK